MHKVDYIWNSPLNSEAITKILNQRCLHKAPFFKIGDERLIIKWTSNTDFELFFTNEHYSRSFLTRHRFKCSLVDTNTSTCVKAFVKRRLIQNFLGIVFNAIVVFMLLYSLTLGGLGSPIFYFAVLLNSALSIFFITYTIVRLRTIIKSTPYFLEFLDSVCNVQHISNS